MSLPVRRNALRGTALSRGMGVEEETPITEERSATAAFEPLGHELRLSIIETLGDTEGALSFSAIRDQVGQRDSGQFNYHLDQLRETFVTQTDEGAYELSFAGRQVYGAVLAGRYTKSAAVEDIPIAGSCPLCDGALSGAYRGTAFTVACEGCGERLTEAPIPPGVLEPYPVEEYPRVAWQYLSTRQMLVDSGFCHLCSGPVETTVEPVEDKRAIDAVGVEWTCNRCTSSFMSTLPAGIAHNELIRAFARDHGVTTEQPIWGAGWLLAGESWIDAEDPLRVGVEIRLDDEALALTLDGELAVLDHRRNPV